MKSGESTAQPVSSGCIDRDEVKTRVEVRREAIEIDSCASSAGKSGKQQAQ